MTPSRILGQQAQFHREREELLRRLGAVRGGLFLLASLSDGEPEPQARRVNNQAPESSEKDPMQPK